MENESHTHHECSIAKNRIRLHRNKMAVNMIEERIKLYGTMNKKCLFTFALLMYLLATSIVYGQAPSIVPVVPEAAALAKEVNYPISPNLGLADISNPLTQIESGGLVLPISLSYHKPPFSCNYFRLHAGTVMLLPELFQN